MKELLLQRSLEFAKVNHFNKTNDKTLNFSRQ